MQSKETRVPSVPETAKQGADPDDASTWSWVEASIWTERMLAALGDGVKGGKWFSLMPPQENLWVNFGSGRAPSA
jgi:RNA-directed DNA polymerase